MVAHTQVSSLIAPYGGSLVDLMVPAEACDEVKAHASQLPSLQLSERSVCDLELLATGAFSPLDRFMGQGDYQRVLHEMRLRHGQLFSLPVTLPVDASPALHLDRDIALRDAKNDLLAVMTIEEIYPWARVEAAQQVFELAVRYQDRHVIGVGIGGDEEKAPPELFRSVYGYAEANGLRLGPKQ